MKTPLTYYGGKQKMAKTIIEMMPKHRIYCEPFFGGGAVFFAKPKSYLEVINDKNDRLITFYRMIQNHFEELHEMVKHTLCSESEYRRARKIYSGEIEASDIEIAWSVWVTINMSFNGSPMGGWKWCNGSAGSHTGVMIRHKREEFNVYLKQRLQDVQISCREALEVIKSRDSKDTFFYLDPPYPGADQKHYRGYEFEHLEELLMLLQDIKGKFILSNYNSELLDSYISLNNWYKREIDMNLTLVNFGNAKTIIKTEVLISNFKKEENLLF